MPRLSLVAGEIVEGWRDEEIRGYYLDSYRHGTPPPTSLAMESHEPEAMRAWCRFWWDSFHRGLVDHAWKEQLRVHIARQSHCDY
jgi:hypothetical protein